MKKNHILLFVVVLLFAINSTGQNTASTISLKAARVLHQNIIKTFTDDIKEKYYDPNMRGIDIEANAKKASALIDDAKTIEEMDDIIARLLYPFDDSHLFFSPPSSTIKVEYGWDMMFVGDKAFVTKIEDDSDAFKKGVRVGDQIYMVEGYIPTRQEFWRFRYHFNILRPQSVLNVILIKPSGNKFKLDLKAKVTEDNVFMPSSRELDLQSEREYLSDTKQLFSDKIPGLAIWKMPNFYLTQLKVGKMMEKVRKSGALILDLRSNGGGYESSMGELINQFFDREITIGEIKERKNVKRLYVKGSDKKSYRGKLVVLTDSDSASAAENFARIVQLEKRGTVIGDQSAGAVMRAQVIYHEFGLDSKIPYALSITVADFIMTDGNRLENIGVTPEEKLLPTAFDLAAKRDPVLARAAEILGFKMTPEEAGQIFEDKK